MKSKHIIKKVIAIIIISTLFVSLPAAAQSDWEFYFFGVNVKAFKDSNWAMVTTGMVVSMLTHELGHALYLESQGKEWDMKQSPLGVNTYTNDHLTPSQYRKLGQSGFLLQTGIGTILSSFKGTKNLDFTKGWVSVNAVQVFTYNQRNQDDVNDFALIEKGGGDQRLALATLSFVSKYNVYNLDPSSTPRPYY